MNFKKTLFASLIFVNFCSAEVSLEPAFNSNQTLWDTTVLGSTFYVARELRSHFTDGRKKMKQIERKLTRAGIRVKKEALFGIPMIGFKTTFRGLEYTLSAYQKDIETFQNLQTKELCIWAVIPFLIKYGWISGSNLYDSVRG